MPEPVSSTTTPVKAIVAIVFGAIFIAFVVAIVYFFVFVLSDDKEPTTPPNTACATQGSSCGPEGQECCDPLQCITLTNGARVCEAIPAPTTTSCAGQGYSCGAAQPCCASLVCTGGRCTPEEQLPSGYSENDASACIARGGDCQENSDCCSQSCNGADRCN